ncbi:MAG: ParB/RepB/Spo0J family partition protein [Thalassospira sp.]|uniref:ParB/RepB/Spo0J family partition protein n=1 Tax=Thalassospira sp. TaxID=1912094 RepID=UPI003A87403B
MSPSLSERLAEQESKAKEKPAETRASIAIPTVDVATHGTQLGVMKTHKYTEFDVARLRQWKYHNRSAGWLERDEQRMLEASIKKHGQHTLGLVRRVDGEAGIDGEIIFGYRRSQACLANGLQFKAKVVPADTPDIECMELMHTENAESEDVSELENAVIYARLLKDGVYRSQRDLAASLNVSQPYINRLMSTTAIFDYDWLTPVVMPLLPDVSVRTASALAAGLKDPQTQRSMREAARRIVQDGVEVTAGTLQRELIPPTKGRRQRKKQKDVLRKVGRNNVVLLEHDDAGNVSLTVKPYEQSADERTQLLTDIMKALDQHIKK